MKNLVMTICAGIGMMFAITYCDASKTTDNDRVGTTSDTASASTVDADVPTMVFDAATADQNYCIDNTPAPVLSSSAVDAATIPTVVIAASASANTPKPPVPVSSVKSSSHK